MGLTNRAQAFQAVGALQWQAGEVRVQTKSKCEQYKLLHILVQRSVFVTAFGAEYD